MVGFNNGVMESNNISLPDTNTLGTTGIYSLQGVPFLHNYGPTGGVDANTFLGIDSGDLTTSAVNLTGIGANTLTSITTGIQNTSVGSDCLSSLTSGVSNSALGYYAMQASTTANYCVCLGESAGEGTNGNANIAIGPSCFADVSVGHQCVAIGNGAFYSGSDPVNSIAIGNQPLSSCTTASEVIAIGTTALYELTSGNNNIALGNGSLTQLKTGTDNLAFGVSSGYNYTTNESHNINILNSGIVGESNAINIGTPGTQTKCSIAGISGVATANSQIVTINTSTGQLGSQPIQGVTKWTVVGASQALVPNNGYICTSGAALAFSLPATAAVGTMISLTLDGATSWSISQGVGQSIQIGPTSTTPGIAGSITSAAQGDTVTMVCSVADTRWNVVSFIGALVVV